MWSEKRKLGNIGEDKACEFLKKQGFYIVERNFLKKWGEIDIVASQSEKLHFIEVKTVSRETNVSIGVGFRYKEENNDSYRPEDNIHPQKLRRLARTIQSYLIEKDVSDETEWQFDVITVVLDKGQNVLKIDFIEDLII